MRDAVRVWRGVNGLEKERVCEGFRMKVGCVFERRKVDLGVRTEDGRRWSIQGLGFMLADLRGFSEGQRVPMDG